MPSRTTVERARLLRRAMTPPEIRLWAILRTRPGDLRFRRQHPIGPYVLDFYCPATRLAIEIDGIAHDMGRNPERDLARDALLEKGGVITLRIAARDVIEETDAVVRLILDRCHTRILPSFAGEGDRA